MSSYPLSLRAGHLLVDRGTGIELIDTGSPISMPLPEIARRVVGEDVTRLIGCDELERVPWTLDLASFRLRLGGPRPTGGGVALSRVMGVPVLKVETPAGERAAFFDTGAALSYGDAADLAGIPVTGERDDFHPMIGQFRTVVREVRLRIGRRAVLIEVGELPPTLGRLLGLTGTQWILGPSAFAGRSIRIELEAGGGMLWDRPGMLSPSRRLLLSFPRYFEEDFRTDLEWIRGGVPLMHGGAEEQPDGGVTLQADVLVQKNRRIRALRFDRVDLLALAIFWSVALDQAVYTYGPDSYPLFRAATRFPKLRGPCPGGCVGHMSPIVALAATGRSMRSDGMFPRPSSERLDSMKGTVSWASDYLGELERVGVLPAGGEIWDRIMADGDVGLGA